MKKTPITPIRNFANNSNNLRQISQSSVKRKYLEIDQRKGEALEKTKFIKNKLDDIYEKFLKSNSDEWKDELLFELKQENIVDITGDLPRSLNTKGSNLMEYSKFWILFIELKCKAHEMELMQSICIFNNALLFDLNDLGLFQSFMNRFIQDHYKNSEVHKVLVEINGESNRIRVPEKEEDITTEHYKYLLECPEVYSDAKLKTLYKTDMTPYSSKTKKISNTADSKNNFIFLSAKGNNIPEKSFNTISTWTKNNINVIEKNNLTSAIKSTSMFTMNEALKPEEDTNKTADFLTSQNEFSFEADLKIANSKLKPRLSEAINPSVENRNIEYNPSYKELIVRNKFGLEIENVTIFQIVSEGENIQVNNSQKN